MGNNKLMCKIRRFFGEYDMSWPKVIIFAIVTAVYTALINQVPFLKNTSFQDIAINLECWILFALFIILNCKTWWEASLKCFVFFLIGQPLIYLIEVPFHGWSIFQYYRYWFIVTLLTLPGAAIAFQLKRKNWLSVAVLSAANVYLAYASAEYFRSTSTDFPHHLLSAIFCLALGIFLTFLIFDNKKHIITALAIMAAVFIAVFVISGSNRSQTVSLGDGSWTESVMDNSIVSVEMLDENDAIITAKKNGTTYVYFENSEGELRTYYVTVLGGGVFVTQFDDDSSAVSTTDISASDISGAVE